MKFATLIIDMQEDFFVHERLSRLRPALVQSVNELVQVCRQHQAAVIWVKQEFAPDLNDAMLDAKRGGIRIVIAGTPGAQLLVELDYRPSDDLIVKKRYSPFFGTTLDDLLARLQPSHLIVAGINSHACVRTAVVDAYQRDYDIVLARDCINSYDLEHHEISWRYMDGRLGRGMSNAEIRSLLAGALPSHAPQASG